MQTCSVCHAQSFDSISHCTNCDADLAQFSETSIALKRIKENLRISYVRIAVSDNCCPACIEAEGAYAKDEAPFLPVEGCSHNLGCRCYYQPVLETLFP